MLLFYFPSGFELWKEEKEKAISEGRQLDKSRDWSDEREQYHDYQSDSTRNYHRETDRNFSSDYGEDTDFKNFNEDWTHQTDKNDTNDRQNDDEQKNNRREDKDTDSRRRRYNDSREYRSHYDDRNRSHRYKEYDYNESRYSPYKRERSRHHDQRDSVYHRPLYGDRRYFSSSTRKRTKENKNNSPEKKDSDKP